MIYVTALWLNQAHVNLLPHLLIFLLNHLMTKW